MRALLLIVGLAGCADEPVLDTAGLTDTGSDPVEDTVHEEPVPDHRVDSDLAVAIDEASFTQDGDTVWITGTASETGPGALPIKVSLTSDVDGPLWTGRPLSDGTWAWTGTLSPGEHELEARVTDGVGEDAVAVAQVVVEHYNRAPSCGIASPDDGASFGSSEPIPFVAAWEDPDGDKLTLMWMSDIYGPIFMGESWDVVLPPGTHQVTLTGDDGHGMSCEDEITVIVRGSTF